MTFKSVFNFGVSDPLVLSLGKHPLKDRMALLKTEKRSPRFISRVMSAGLIAAGLAFTVPVTYAQDRPEKPQEAQKKSKAKKEGVEKSKSHIIIKMTNKDGEIQTLTDEDLEAFSENITAFVGENLGTFIAELEDVEIDDITIAEIMDGGMEDMIQKIEEVIENNEGLNILKSEIANGEFGELLDSLDMEKFTGKLNFKIDIDEGDDGGVRTFSFINKNTDSEVKAIIDESEENADSRSKPKVTKRLQRTIGIDGDPDINFKEVEGLKTLVINGKTFTFSPEQEAESFKNTLKDGKPHTFTTGNIQFQFNEGELDNKPSSIQEALKRAKEKRERSEVKAGKEAKSKEWRIRREVLKTRNEANRALREMERSLRQVEKIEDEFPELSEELAKAKAALEEARAEIKALKQKERENRRKKSDQ